jgi:hypothetical protein
MAASLLVLALAFHRAPLAFRHLTDPQRPLPEGFGAWLTEASAALAPAHLEGTAADLGTAPEALREAYLFLLRQVLLVPQADHYRVLGLGQNCSPEAVKQHHGLLVRLFHPDRLPESDERGGSLTARINNAYQILKDPQARRRYDKRLPPPSGDGRWSEDPRAFFRPQGPVLPGEPRPTEPVLPRSRAGSVVGWLLAGASTMGLVYAIVREPGLPLLRVNPDLGSGAAPGPAYVHGDATPAGRTQPQSQPAAGPSQGPRPGADEGSPQTRPPAVLGTATLDGSKAGGAGHATGPAAARVDPGRQGQKAAAAREAPVPEREHAAGDRDLPRPAPGEVPVPAPVRQAQRASASERPKDAGFGPHVSAGSRPDLGEREERQPADRGAWVRGASELVGRLEGSFASGDLAGLVTLFTANAVVNDGIGAAGVRATYNELIGRGGQRRMTLSGLSWRPGQHDRLLGRGIVRISTRSGPGEGWSDVAGTVDIELVPGIGDYKVAKWIHRLSRK